MQSTRSTAQKSEPGWGYIDTYCLTQIDASLNGESLKTLSHDTGLSDNPGVRYCCLLLTLLLLSCFPASDDQWCQTE